MPEPGGFFFDLNFFRKKKVGKEGCGAREGGGFFLAERSKELEMGIGAWRGEVELRGKKLEFPRKIFFAHS